MTTASSSPPLLTVSTPASLRNVYLRRLERLVRLRRRHARELNQRGLRLLDRAVFAAYCACRDIGIESEARAALRNAPAAQDLAPTPQPPAAYQPARADC